MMRLGVYGHGPQSKRYLDPLNWPDGVEVVQLEREGATPPLSGAIVATAPGYHFSRVMQTIAYPILLEKPMTLSLVECVTIAQRRRKLLVSHTHLWHPDFIAIHPSKTAMVQWCGEERADGSCPAILDWGPHAWSMAIALGTDRVITGKGDRTKNVVRSRGKEYNASNKEARPMKAMLETFAHLIDGGYDWRAEPDFALEVHRRCFTGAGSSHRSA